MRSESTFEIHFQEGRIRSFDKQVALKMGSVFGDEFLQSVKKLVEAGLSYEAGKRLVKIPATKRW
ncbi:MAG: hypothetical protein ABSH35_31480 [Isosphaeraceae bacterium]|jgi:hypothetical protein